MSVPPAVVNFLNAKRDYGEITTEQYYDLLDRALFSLTIKNMPILPPDLMHEFRNWIPRYLTASFTCTPERTGPLPNLPEKFTNWKFGRD